MRRSTRQILSRIRRPTRSNTTLSPTPDMCPAAACNTSKATDRSTDSKPKNLPAIDQQGSTHPKTAYRLKPGKNNPITEHNEHYRTLQGVFDWDAVGSVKRV